MYPRLVSNYYTALDVLELLLPLSARIISGHHYIQVMQCYGLNSGFSECQSSTLPTKPHLLPPSPRDFLCIFKLCSMWDSSGHPTGALPSCHRRKLEDSSTDFAPQDLRDAATISLQVYLSTQRQGIFWNVAPSPTAPTCSSVPFKIQPLSLANPSEQKQSHRSLASCKGV